MPKPDAAASESDLRDLVGRSRLEKFEKRLAWAGLTLAEANVTLNGTSYAPSDADWPEIARDILVAAHHLKHFAADRVRSASRECDKNNEIERGRASELTHRAPGDAAQLRSSDTPYFELLEPAVMVARSRLMETLRTAGLPTNPKFIRELEANLVIKLRKIASPTFQTEFENTLPLGYKLLTRLAVQINSETPPNDRYLRFISRSLRNGLLTICSRYPVLLRLLAISVTYWVNNSALLIRRLTSESLPLSNS